MLEEAWRVKFGDRLTTWKCVFVKDDAFVLGEKTLNWKDFDRVFIFKAVNDELILVDVSPQLGMITVFASIKSDLSTKVLTSLEV